MVAQKKRITCADKHHKHAKSHPTREDLIEELVAGGEYYNVGELQHYSKAELCQLLGLENEEYEVPNVKRAPVRRIKKAPVKRTKKVIKKKCAQKAGKNRNVPTKKELINTILRRGRQMGEELSVYKLNKLKKAQLCKLLAM